jgi:hypothetical protein
MSFIKSLALTTLQVSSWCFLPTVRIILYIFSYKLIVKCLLNILFCTCTVISSTLHIINNYFANGFVLNAIITLGKNINCWYFKVEGSSKIFGPKNELGFLKTYWLASYTSLHQWVTCVVMLLYFTKPRFCQDRHVLQISATLHNRLKKVKGENGQ